jgi:hypothetical protein
LCTVFVNAGVSGSRRISLETTTSPYENMGSRFDKGSGIVLFVELIFRISTIKFRGISHFLMQNRHTRTQFFSLLSMHGLLLLEKSANGHFEARCEKLLAVNDAASQAVLRTSDEKLCIWK